MRRILIVQPDKMIADNKIEILNKYVRDSFEEGVLVLNKGLNYEVIEIDVSDKVETQVDDSAVEKCEGEVVGSDEDN